MQSLIARVAPYVAAALAGGLAIANTDLNRLENFVLAAGPVAVAALFNFVRAELKKA